MSGKPDMKLSGFPDKRVFSVMKDKLDVMIVDDEALLRDGLISMLGKEIFIGKLYEAEDAEQFKYQLNSHNFSHNLISSF